MRRLLRSRRAAPAAGPPTSSAATSPRLATGDAPPGSTPPEEPTAAARAAEQDGRFLDAIDLLREANRDPDPDIERALVDLRHRAFDEVEHAQGRPSWPPEYRDHTPSEPGPPEVTPADLSSDVLGSALVNHGALWVRELLSPSLVDELVSGIDAAFAGRDAWEDDPTGDTAPWFVPFEPLPRHRPPHLSRAWVREGGGVWAADSPRVFRQMLDAFDGVGLRTVIGGYLGERPAISMRKCTLRRVPAALPRADWHQDGSFLGADIRSVNVWLALTDCGGDADAPGLEYIPRRVDHIVETGTEGAMFAWSVGPGVVDSVGSSLATTPIRPRFRAGDALLFDDLFLHRTATDPGLTRDRYAIESWFFAPSTYPSDQIPLIF